jgi:hypothetical protein
VTPTFPEIVSYGSAFRFALSAEEACAEIAAAAAARAPDELWRAKLDELVGAHRDRVEKLTVVRQEVNEMILEPIHTLSGRDYLGALDRAPEEGWPALVEQLIEAEQDTARYHEDLVSQCEDVLAASARAFRKAAKQDRMGAAELREMLAR